MSGIKSELPGRTPFSELCDAALRHYEEVSDKAQSWLSTVPHAIEFFKMFGSESGLPRDAPEKSVPLCSVHQTLEDCDQLEVQISGMNCVACSLNERAELLLILEPCAPIDQSKDSVTVLREVVDFWLRTSARAESAHVTTKPSASSASDAPNPNR